jgi:hypothetical protein
MSIDLSDTHPSNALISIDISSEHSSNVTVASDSHSLKQLSRRARADLGIRTDERPLHPRNAPPQITDSFEFGSKKTDPKFLKPDNDCGMIYSMKLGILTSLSHSKKRTIEFPGTLTRNGPTIRKQSFASETMILEQAVLSNVRPPTERSQDQGYKATSIIHNREKQRHQSPTADNLAQISPQKEPSNPEKCSLPEIEPIAEHKSNAMTSSSQMPSP